MNFKLNKMRGMSTLKEDRKLAADVSREVQNFVPEVGQDVIRGGFVKCNTTKYAGVIQALFDYKTRYGVYTPVIPIDDGTIIAGPGSFYVVDAPAGITQNVNFTLNITAYDIYGNQATGYNGTADLTENGVGSLNTGTLTFVQGYASSATMQYDGSVDGESLTITATDDSDSTVVGSDTTIVTATPAFSNLALNKPTTTSSEPSAPSYASSKINDGVPTSSWLSDNADNEWCRIDLESSYTLTRYSLSFWEYGLATGGYITEFKIQYSTNDSDWSDALSITGNSTTIFTEASFSVAKTGRYWRYLGIARGGGGGVGHLVTELELSE